MIIIVSGASETPQRPRKSYDVHSSGGFAIGLASMPVSLIGAQRRSVSILNQVSLELNVSVLLENPPDAFSGNSFHLKIRILE